MIPKPSSCIGCPFEHMGKYYTPDIVVPGSEVYILAQNPGENEEKGRKLRERRWNYGSYTDIYEEVQPQPLLGATGNLFNDKFLPLSGLTRSEVSIGNAIRCRPGRELGLRTANSLPTITTKMRLEHSSADIVNALKHCQQAHFHPPSSTKVVMAMGRYAMFALTGIQNEDSEYGTKQGVLESWRGYAVTMGDFRALRTVDTSYYHDINILRDKVVFFTQHIASLFESERNKRFYHATLNDFYKLKLILQGKWPHTVPTWDDCVPDKWPKWASFDTEYIPDLDDQLIRWTLGDFHGNYYCVEADDSFPIELADTTTNVLIQNALSSADLRHLKDIIDISKAKIHDLMIADSVLWTGEPHNLNFIQSKVGSLNRHKHLGSTQPQLYAVMDVHQPEYIWKTHHMKEFQKDQKSWKVYTQLRLPLIEPIRRAHKYGAKVDTARLKEVQTIIKERLEQYEEEARAITGNEKFKLSGRKGVMEELYGE